MQQSKNDDPCNHAYVKCKWERNAPSKDADGLGDIADEVLFVCLFCFIIEWDIREGKINNNLFQVRRMTW